MTDVQIFQLLGLAYFAIGVGMLINPAFIKNIMRELEHSTAYMYYGGLISFTIGFLLVSFHNVWVADRSLIITILGWLALLKGLSFLMFPAYVMRLYKGIDRHNYLISYSTIFLGIVALYFGYVA